MATGSIGAQKSTDMSILRIKKTSYRANMKAAPPEQRKRGNEIGNVATQSETIVTCTLSR